MKTLLALVLAALLCGCSMVRVAYENADSYLRWRAGSYLDVHGTQVEELDAAIDAFHDWHRRSALPTYARLAAQAAARVEDGVAPEDLLWGYDSLRTQLRSSVREGAVRLAPVLAKLDAQQIAHLESRLAEDNRRFAREFLRGTEEARRARRAERIVKRLEDWVGRLSDAQVERVRQYSERVPLMGAMRERDNRRLQAALLELLRADRKETFKENLVELAEHWERDRDPVYAAAIESSRREVFAMLLDIDAGLSAEQRARAVASLRRYAADFQQLAGKKR
ncbi:MAG: DUF6279 family lipoprotein [Betaproteobacteria bacterium]